MPNFVGFLRLATTGALAVLLSFGGGGAAGALYDVSPGEIPGKPGSIIRIWPLEGGGPGMGGNGDAFRILYRSTNPSGQPIAVSGAGFVTLLAFSRGDCSGQQASCGGGCRCPSAE